MDPLRVMLSFLLGFPLIAPDSCGPVAETEDVEDWDDDDWDDDDTPDYAGEIDMGQAIMEASCTVDVPLEEEDDGYPAAGTFQFDLAMDGWASECWIEMWDDASEYCEGFDEYGDPCDDEELERPGWWFLQGDYGYDANIGFWDSWYLDLDYEHSWPPAPHMSYFTCEGAGNDPEEGDGEFITYFCCTDMATDYLACALFRDW